LKSNEHLTVCVTGAGADGGTPSDWEMKRRGKLLGIAAESPASSARFVSRDDIRSETFVIF